jgi:hypothetical protein
MVPRLRFPAVRQGVASKTIESKIPPKGGTRNTRKTRGTKERYQNQTCDSDSGSDCDRDGHSDSDRDSDSDSDGDGSRGSRLARGVRATACDLRAVSCDFVRQGKWNADGGECMTDCDEY